jgi:hypothetical protein
MEGPWFWISDVYCYHKFRLSERNCWADRQISRFGARHAAEVRREDPKKTANGAAWTGLVRENGRGRVKMAADRLESREENRGSAARSEGRSYVDMCMRLCAGRSFEPGGSPSASPPSWPGLSRPPTPFRRGARTPSVALPSSCSL